MGLKSVTTRSKNSLATTSSPSFSTYFVSTLSDHHPVSSFGVMEATRLICGWCCLIQFQKMTVSGGDGKLGKVEGFFGLTKPSADASGRFKTQRSVSPPPPALTTGP